MTLDYMTPVSSMLDRPHIWRGDPIILRNCTNGPGVCPDGSDLFLGEFGCGSTCPASPSGQPRLQGMPDVSASGDPLKVAEVVVGFIPVDVVSIHVGGWSDERFQHQPVHTACSKPSPRVGDYGQLHGEIPVRTPAWLQEPGGRAVTHATMAADFIAIDRCTAPLFGKIRLHREFTPCGVMRQAVQPALPPSTVPRGGAM